MLVNGHMYVLGGATSQSATLESESDSDATTRSDGGGLAGRTPRLQAAGDGEGLEGRIAKLAHALMRACADTLAPLFPEAPSAAERMPSDRLTDRISAKAASTRQELESAPRADTDGAGTQPAPQELSRASSFGSVRTIESDNLDAEGLHEGDHSHRLPSA